MQRGSAEQRHHPEGERGLHQEAAEGHAQAQGPGRQTETAGGQQPANETQNTGLTGCTCIHVIMWLNLYKPLIHRSFEF